MKRLVTSTYLDPSSVITTFLPKSKRRSRYNEYLHTDLVKSIPLVDLAKLCGRLFGKDVWWSMMGERYLAQVAKRISADGDICLSYNYLAHLIFPGITGTKILFQCHPNFALLRSRYLANPSELTHRFFQERELAWGATYASALESEWVHADLILAPSSFVKKSLIVAGANPSKIIVIPYGCTREPRRSIEVRKISGQRTLLFVGQLVWRKGADLLPELMSELGPSYRLVVVSRGIIDESIALRLRNHENIEFLYNISKSRLQSIYQESHALIFPSRFEGYGLVINEALANGLPVISTSSTALPDILSKYSVGQLIECYEVSEIAEKVRQLFHADYYAYASESARVFANENPWEKFRSRIYSTVEGLF